MPLSDHQLRLSYRTGRDDLVRDFFVPCLERSVLYRRAAGYFSSHGLALAARGVAGLVLAGGKMRLVVSPHLEPDDVAALEQAADRPHEVLRGVAARSLAEIEDALVKERLNTLAWLAASGLLEIRLALRTDAQGRPVRGLFHEKAGVFTDQQDNHVAFAGSANETAGGFVENFESLKVFTSWQEATRVEEEIANFEALWGNQTAGLRIIEFTEAGRDLLERFRDPDNRPPGLPADTFEAAGPARPFAPPAGFDLRPYQADAIRAWSQAGGKGILAMATGTGKTPTALTLASKVAEKNQPLVLVVVCPFINLCRQWVREMAAFGLAPVPCFEGRDQWESLLEEGYQRLATRLTEVHAIVATNSTFQGEAFQSRLRARLGTAHHLLIADEVHNLGAAKVQDTLPEGIAMRLGLSATPERHYDPVGTQALVDYFGGVVFEYPIARAIAEGRLCPYRYHPVLVELTDPEADEYLSLTLRLRPMLAGKDDDEELGPAALGLLLRRARLLAGAENKLAALDRVVAALPERPRKAIFYCGDGRTTDAITDEETRQIQAVARLLGEKHGLRVRNFTYRESAEEREEILRDLASGFLDGVVAIRCLDEGIDLPDLRMGFLLASSTNPRQFVQRRGRLLRHAPGKDRAIIHDFIIQPPDLGGQDDADAFNLERSFFARELARISEFCRTAENGPEAMGALAPLRSRYGTLAC